MYSPTRFAFGYHVGDMPPRVMSPSRREMDQLAGSQREGDYIESIVSSEPQEIVDPPEVLQEMLSSLTVDLSAEEVEMLPGLMQRVHECRRAREETQGQVVEAPQGRNNPQDTLDGDGDQGPDDEDFSDEEDSAPASQSEWCSVCERPSCITNQL